MGQVVSALGAIFGVRLMTQALSPSEYGSLSLALTIWTLTLQIVLSPLAGSVLRFYSPSHELQQFGPFWQAVKWLVARSTYLVAAMALLFLIVALSLGQSPWAGVLVATFVYSLVTGYIGILNGVQNAARQRVIVAWHDGLGAWLRYLLAVILIWSIAPTSLVVLVGFTLASSLVLLSQWYFFRRIILRSAGSQASNPEAEQQWRSSMFTFAWPFAVWGLFTWLHASSDRWVLQYFGTTELVGLYTVLYQLSVYPVVLLTGLLLQLVTPILYNRAGDGSDPARLHQARRFVLYWTFLILIATGLGAGLSWLLHSWLFSWLVAPEYRSVSSYMPWMVLGAGAFAAGQVASLDLMIGNRSEKLIVPKVTTALAGVLLNIVGGYYWGLEGVIAGGILFSMLWLFWMLLKLLTATRIHSSRQNVKIG